MLTQCVSSIFTATLTSSADLVCVQYLHSHTLSSSADLVCPVSSQPHSIFKCWPSVCAVSSQPLSVFKCWHSVCVQYLHAFKQWSGCQCLGFLTCTQLTHVIAHSGCTNTISLHWNLSLGEKSLVAPRNQTCASSVSDTMLNQLSYITAPFATLILC